MADIRRIPFTEIVERVQKDLARDNSNAESVYKGRVNSVYMYDIPSEIDYRHIRKTGTVTLKDDYTTGTIALTNASTTCTGTGTTWTSANSNGFLLKANNYDEIYRVTYSAAGTLTLDRTWVEATDTSESYKIYLERYALASDFERLIMDPDECVYYWRQGVKIYLKYVDAPEFEGLQTYVPGVPDKYTIKYISGDPYIFVNPAPNQAWTLNYEYIQSLPKMTEYTTGTITTLANGGTAVTGSGTDFDGYVTDTDAYDYYFRIDGDGTGASSKWYKVASVASNTSLTLSDAYAGTAIAAGTSNFTISTISLLPAGLDLALLYGAALISAVDQDNNSQTQAWSALYGKIVAQYKAVESKRGYGKQRVRTIYEKPGVRR